VFGVGVPLNVVELGGNNGRAHIHDTWQDNKISPRLLDESINQYNLSAEATSILPPPFFYLLNFFPDDGKMQMIWAMPTDWDRKQRSNFNIRQAMQGKVDPRHSPPRQTGLAILVSTSSKS
jgi:hypothetical protein